MKKNIKLLLSIVTCAVLMGCSSKEHLPGTRQPLITSAEFEEEMVAGVDHTPVIMDSGSEQNADFVQAHLKSSHYYLPLNFSISPRELWRSSLDFEASKSIKMTAAAVVAEGKVFCIDAAGIVYAFDQKTGKQIWRISTTVAGKDGQIGGALAYDAGRLVVTSSFAEAFSVDAQTGKILWRIKLPAASKGDGISIHDGKAFIQCSNSSIHKVDISTGKILWSHSGMVADNMFIGSSCPAVDDGVVYFAYPSGEVFALLEETGAVIWDAMLAKFSITNASNAFSHPRACPVVKGGIVYFVGANEQTNAFDIKTGKLLWRSDYGGVQTPVLSGDNIFVFSSKSELVCLNARTGKQRWATSLETDSNLIADWYGMTLIKDHILMVAPGGRLIYVSAYDGKIKNVVTIDGSGDGISVNPVIADGVLYLLLNSGQIVAYR